MITLCLLFVSCKNTQIKNKEPEDEITFKDYEGIDNTSVIYNKNGKISLIGDIYSNKILSSKEEGHILSYKKETNSYLKALEKDEDVNLILGISNKEYNLKNFTEIDSAKQSPKGDLVLYKRYNEDEEIEFSIFDSNKSEDIPLEIDTLISGQNYFWKDNNTIIYYGINEKEEKNGIYSYDIHYNKEKLLYEVKQGIIEYMQMQDENIYFILNSLKGSKMLDKFSFKDSSLSQITNKFKYINSIIEKEGTIYILGEEENSGMSLYSINNNNLKKIIYDFPKQIDSDKGMIKDKNDNILFIGFENIEEEEDIYAYNVIEKDIKIISKKTGEYFFIETN